MKTSDKESNKGLQYFPYMWEQLRGNRKTLIYLFFISLCLSLISLVSAALSKNVVDKVFVGLDLSYVFRILPFVVSLYVFTSIMSVVQTYISANLLAKFSSKIKMDFFKELQKSTYRFLLTIGANDIYYRMFVDTSIFVNYFINILIIIPVDLILVVTTSFLMIHWSWKLAIFIFVFIIIQIILVLFFRAPIRKSTERLRKIEQKLASDVNENFRIIDSIKLFNLENYQYNMFNVAFDKYIKSNLRNVFLGSLYVTLIGLLNQIWSIGSLVIGAHLAISGELTIGSFMGIYMLANTLYKPLIDIVDMFFQYQETSISFERFKEYYTQVDEREYYGTLPFKFKKSLKLENVSFRYNDNHKVLNNVSLELQPSNIVAIIGPSGVGKTTIAKLLTRLLFPDSGCIMIDGVNICDIDYNQYRKNVCLMMQKPIIINDTFCKNILLDMDYNEDNFYNVISDTNLKQVVSRLPDGIETKLGIDGCNLSEGEIQRLSLARILLRRPKILILDEPTSHLDLKTSDQILNSIVKYKNQTDALVLLITHDKETHKYVDYIITIDDSGNIISNNSSTSNVVKI